MPLDFNHPVQTRDGRPARIICTDCKSAYPVIALVDLSRDGTEAILTYTPDGLLVEGREGNPADLVNTPERLTGWVNIYDGGLIYSSQAEADLKAGPARIAVAYIDTERPA